MDRLFLINAYGIKIATKKVIEAILIPGNCIEK